MTFKSGDLVKDKITKQKYYVLKTREKNTKDTPLARIGKLFTDEDKPDVFCKRSDGVTGWKYAAELELEKRTP